MATGTVKWFNPTKGYGFIQPQGGGGKDIFVHISAVERAGLSSLNEGQHVEYELESTREGKQAATNLKVKKASRLWFLCCRSPTTHAPVWARAHRLRVDQHRNRARTAMRRDAQPYMRRGPHLQ